MPMYQQFSVTFIPIGIGYKQQPIVQVLYCCSCPMLKSYTALLHDQQKHNFNYSPSIPTFMSASSNSSLTIGILLLRSSSSSSSSNPLPVKSRFFHQHGRLDRNPILLFHHGFEIDYCIGKWSNILFFFLIVVIVIICANNIIGVT